MVSLEDSMKVLSPDNRKWMEGQSPDQQKHVLGYFQDLVPDVQTVSPGRFLGSLGSDGVDAGAANDAV